jgi:diguanylate cyclase (GGDEF)-like protein/PAS domain S-box-containing protein
MGRGTEQPLRNALRGSEALLQLQHGVTRCLVQARGVPAAVRAVLRVVCTTKGWDCGRFFAVDEARGDLVCTETWGRNRAALRAFLRRSRGLRMARGAGLVGRVWRTGRPLWVADVRQDRRIANPLLAASAGILGALVFPVTGAAGILGVITISSREVRRPDPRLLRAMEVVGRQLGQFLHHRRLESALRESEARFRSLAELSADWYWEQDADLRFTHFTGGQGDAAWGGNQRLSLGLRRWEIPRLTPLTCNWEEHRALLQARKPFRGFEYMRLTENGSRRYVSSSGEPVYDTDGGFKGYRGTATDITGRKAAELRIRLEHRVTQHLAQAANPRDGLAAVMRDICESDGWDCGQYFEMDAGATVLHLRDAWSVEDPRVRQFIEDSGTTAWPRGSGVAGRVWDSGEPLWVADVRDAPQASPPERRVIGEMRATFAFPVTLQARTIGVLSIAGRNVREPDEALLGTMRTIGSQLGQFLRRVQMEEALLRFRAGMDASADMILLVDPKRMRYLDVNETVCRTLGYSRDEILAMGPQDILPVAREELQRAYEALIANPASMPGMNSVYRCKDGSSIPFESTRRLLRSGDGVILVVISRDIRKRLETEAALRDSEARFRSLTQLSSDFFWETDISHRLVEIENAPKYGEDARLDPEVAKAPWDIPSLKPDAAGWAAHRAQMEARQPFRNFEYARPGADGRPRHFAVSGEPRTDAEGRFAGYRGVGHEITEIVEARERIAALAYSDALTGLANRASFTPALEHAVRRARRNGAKLAVLYLDLDGFKQVNDSHGHETGDRLLVEVARRLRGALRASDLLARLGGDEFVAVLEDLPAPPAAELVARKLVAEIDRPYPILSGGGTCRVSASVGVSLFPADADSPRELLQRADAAMYRAKQDATDHLRFHAPDAAP